MAKIRLFTQDQVAALNANPYTHKATERTISFTQDFKEFFYSKIREGKLTNTNIFKAAGYDPEVLGITRMETIRKAVLREAGSPEGFKPPRGLSHAEVLEKARKEEEEAASAQAKIKGLEARVTHLEAQVEFLKKTAAIRKRHHDQLEL